MSSRFALVLATAILASCAAPSAIRVSDGNQSDGTVILAYDYSLMQSPKVDWQQGLQKATAQCQGWGYNGAIPAEKPSQSCKTETEEGDCIAWTITAGFQCTAPSQPASN